MSKTIDAKGQNCPIPVIMAKKEIEAGGQSFIVEVDNTTAVRNLEKLASTRGFASSVEEGEGVYRVAFSKDGEAVCPAVQDEKGSNWVVFVGRETIGSGSDELGAKLMKMYFYTIAQESELPSAILFMNGGVKLPVLNDQIVEHLRDMQSRGTEILVCGTCLNFFEIADKLQVGTVSNMFDITQRMLYADKVISL